MLPAFAYVRPRSLKDAITQLATPGARAHAGGTDLIGCLRDQVLTVERVVSISGLDELRGLSVAGDGSVRIGALTTVAEIAGHAGLKATHAALAQAASLVASPQLRNQGTLGGNLCQRPRCWYFRGEYDCARKGGDMCYAILGDNRYHAIFGGSGCFIVHPSDTAPALVALGASARIQGPQGSRTLPLEQFFVGPDKDIKRENALGPGELLAEVLVPAAAPGTKSCYLKVRARGSWDFAMAGVAAVVSVKNGKVDSARIVLSGVAPVPWRVKGAETALVGQKLEPKTIARVAEAAVAGAQPMDHNEYKVAMVRGVVEDALSGLA
jgi:xanthine dehydrogenase YagS FAD-binding subunit